ncbi:hypothetical protein ACN38_g11446 [Penicillium nordicum]|uniref:Protein kinase domain-containing protein n=1 Tax=Penicillium nordicum TaxID=229535 RepID=A0A0M8NYT2_9EURO|nr:hypothetical protein ACN38_g11446 [Penicillium nordicum]
MTQLDLNNPSLTAIAENNPQCQFTNVNRDGLNPKRHGLPHLGHPTLKYSMNWKVDQAGCGWLSLGNYFGYSTVLIKRKTADKKLTNFFKLQVAFHENIVGLVEAFYDSEATHLVYNYYGFAVNLSQVGLTPAVQLSEIDLASICRSILRGLEYIHEQLLIAHGRVDCDNIILCSDGGIKIANIGDSMIDDRPTSMDSDREKVGLLLLQLGDPQRPLYKREDQARAQRIELRLSKYAIHFVEHISSASFSYLFEHAFLQQVQSDSRTWFLIPHYLDTIMHWGVLPQEKER